MGFKYRAQACCVLGLVFIILEEHWATLHLLESGMERAMQGQGAASLVSLLCPRDPGYLCVLTAAAGAVCYCFSLCFLWTLHLVPGLGAGAQPFPSSCLSGEQAKTRSELRNACSQVKAGLSDQAFLCVTSDVLFPLP